MHEIDPVAMAAVDLLNELQQTVIGALMEEEPGPEQPPFLLARPDFNKGLRGYLELARYSEKPASQMATALRVFLRHEEPGSGGALEAS